MSAQTVMTHALNQGEESAHIRSLRVALESASEARRAAEDTARDMGYTIPDLHDDVRAACRAEMDAYLALFDARNAPAGMGTGVEHAPVRGVSLVKATDRAGAGADVELCAPYGDGSSYAMQVNLGKTSCDWCELGVVPAFYVAHSVCGDGRRWVERFCAHHAFVWGVFRPVGFVESV